MGDSGIEIHVSNTGTVDKIFKALHALHLDSVGRWMVQNTKAVILVDGNETYQDVTVRHFLAVPPGEHSIGFYYYDRVSSQPQALQEHFNDIECKVTIEPGKITLFDYRLRTITMKPAMTVIGTKDA